MWEAIAGLVIGGVQSVAAQNSFGMGMDAIKANADLARQQMDFNQQQLLQANYELQSVEALFGPIRQNMAKYYANMDPKKYASQANERISKATEQGLDAWDKELARRGIEGSGIQAGGVQNLLAKKSELQGQTLSQAEDYVANQQRNWLAMENGMKSPYLNQQQNAVMGVNNSYGTMLGANQNIANMYTQQAQQQGQDAAGFMNAGMYMYGRSKQYSQPSAGTSSFTPYGGPTSPSTSSGTATDYSNLPKLGSYS